MQFWFYHSFHIDTCMVRCIFIFLIESCQANSASFPFTSISAYGETISPFPDSKIYWYQFSWFAKRCWDKSLIAYYLFFIRETKFVVDGGMLEGKFIGVLEHLKEGDHGGACAFRHTVIDDAVLWLVMQALRYLVHKSQIALLWRA